MDYEKILKQTLRIHTCRYIGRNTVVIVLLRHPISVVETCVELNAVVGSVGGVVSHDDYGNGEYSE